MAKPDKAPANPPMAVPILRLPDPATARPIAAPPAAPRPVPSKVLPPVLPNPVFPNPVLNPFPPNWFEPKELFVRPAPAIPPIAAPIAVLPEPPMALPILAPVPAPRAPPKSEPPSKPPNCACAVTGINAIAAIAALVIRNFIFGSSECRKKLSTTPHKWCCLLFTMQASRRIERFLT